MNAVLTASPAGSYPALPQLNGSSSGREEGLFSGAHLNNSLLLDSDTCPQGLQAGGTSCVPTVRPVWVPARKKESERGTSSLLSQGSTAGTLGQGALLHFSSVAAGCQLPCDA